ncbi:MAG TPA: Hsp20/alpha crystallin family protein [Blastocatellia bacterium]|nr:Hsp20/alpha crystallin family protein [Blastocatellia bacterium]
MVKVQSIHPVEDLASVRLVRTDQWFAGVSQRRVQSDTAGFSPPANIFIGDEEMAVMVDLPGVDRESLQVKVEGRKLTIDGRRLVGPWQKARLRHIEWPYGDFSRTFLLPEDVDPTRISAELNDGILLLRVPKRRRRIPVRTGEGNHV